MNTFISKNSTISTMSSMFRLTSHVSPVPRAHNLMTPYYPRPSVFNMANIGPRNRNPKSLVELQDLTSQTDLNHEDEGTLQRVCRSICHTCAKHVYQSTGMARVQSRHAGGKLQ